MCKCSAQKKTFTLAEKTCYDTISIIVGQLLFSHGFVYLFHVVYIEPLMRSAIGYT